MAPIRGQIAISGPGTPDSRPTSRVVSADIERDGRYLITQRSAHAVLPNLGEFPGGRVRPGESELEALVRSVGLRLGGGHVGPEGRVLEVVEDYPDYKVQLLVYQRSIVSREPEARSVQAPAWVEPDDLSGYALPDADAQPVALLLEDDAPDG